MPYINIGVKLNKKLGIESVVINHNDTGLDSDSELLKQVAMAILKGIILNKDSVAVQDLLNELGIKVG